jgi:hypothetical protein
MLQRWSGTSSPETARAVTKGGGMTFSGGGVILRPSAGRAAIATENVKKQEENTWKEFKKSSRNFNGAAP